MATINELIQQAQKTNDRGLYVQIGDAYKFGRGVARDATMAMSYYQNAADLGSCDGMDRLAAMYYFEDGVSQNCTRAKELWQRSADRGSAQALFGLGLMCYENNYSFFAAKGKAFSFWKKAAMLGHPQAQYNIAASYTSDKWGAEQDYRKAAYWYMCAYQNRMSDKTIVDNARRMLEKLSSRYDLDDIKDEIITNHPEYLNL